MSKKKPVQQESPRQTHPDPQVRDFLAFLAAADVTALKLIACHGVTIEPDADRDFYDLELDRLSKEFRDFETTDIDDVFHFTEADARCDAAHMIGLAIGLRLRGLDFVSGGAR